MNGNPLYHWVALVVSTVLILPLAAAVLLAGWTPAWMRGRWQAGIRLRVYGLLCIYGLMLLNAVPRIADAAYETVMACMFVGFGCIAAAGVLFVLANRVDSRAQAAGLVVSCDG